MSDDLLVLTRVIDASDPYWDQSTTIIGTLQQISATIDLSKGFRLDGGCFVAKKLAGF